MTLSETQASRHPNDSVEVFAPLAPGFPQLLKPPSRRAVLPTPVDRFGAVGWYLARSRAGLFPNRMAFPERTAGRVGIQNFLFEACSSFPHFTARRFARPPSVDFVTRLPSRQLPADLAR